MGEEQPVVISVCVGSSCFLRGANQVIETFEKLIMEYRLGRTATLKGNFCMGECTKGVTVQIDEEILPGTSVEDVPELFERYVLKSLGRMDQKEREGEEEPPCP